MISKIPGRQLSKHKRTAEAGATEYLMWICRLGADSSSGLCEGTCTARTVYLAGGVALEITENYKPSIEEKPISGGCCFYVSKQ